MGPLGKACKAAGKCSSCLIPARWKRRDETPEQLLADPTFIASLPRSLTELGTHLCYACCDTLASIVPTKSAKALRLDALPVAVRS